MAAAPRPAGVELWPRDAVWKSYIEQAAARDEHALARLYDESSGLVYSLALRLLGNEADAEEVTLDVFTQVWKAAADFNQARGTASAWLTMLARSRAIDRLRSRVARSTREQELSEAVEIPDRGLRPDEAGAANQQKRFIREALAALSAEQRQAIELAYFSGLSHSELAEKLGEPLGTVKTRIRLAMMKLRKLLEPFA